MPHPKNGHRAHLVKIPSLAVYLILLIVVQAGLITAAQIRPDILGIKSTVTSQQIIELTNQERAKVGAPAVSDNPLLTTAAIAKAKDMISQNYWSHTAPDGRQPWDFIVTEGYKYLFAGENLARNFTDSDSVVKAWIASPSHKANLLDSHYREIGVAVVEGFYGGGDSVLVVQMFGTRPSQIASLPQTTAATPTPTTIPTVTSAQEIIGGPQPAIAHLPKEVELEPAITIPRPQIASAPTLQETLSVPIKSTIKSSVEPVVDPFVITRITALVMMFFVAGLLAIDWLVISRQRVVRQVGHQGAHALFLILLLALIFSIQAGEITREAVRHVAIF